MLRIKKFDGKLQLSGVNWLEGRMGARTNHQIDDITGAVKPTTEIVFSPNPPYEGELPEETWFLSDTVGYQRCRVSVTRESPYSIILTRLE